MIYTGPITVRFVNIHFYRCYVLNVSWAMNVWLSEISSRLNQSGSAQVICEDIKYKLTIFCWVRCMNDVWLLKWSPEAAAGSPSRHFKDCEAAVILSAPVWSVLVTVTWHTEHSLTANPHKTKLYGLIHRSAPCLRSPLCLQNMPPEVDSLWFLWSLNKIPPLWIPCG